MKIFNTANIHEIDKYTIQHEPIASINLMERAASAVFRWFTNKYPTQPVSIFCGNGNNGGDGLALARQLAEAGYPVKTYILKTPEYFSPDAKINFELLRQQNKAHIIFLNTSLPEIPPHSIVIDALYGSGLNRPLEGFAAQLAHHINQCQCTVIAIDIPSGLMGENNSTNHRNAIIQATYTLCFEMPKLAFLFPENEQQTGEWHILPIGLHPNALQKFDTKFHYTTSNDIKGQIKPRSKFAHKGTFGKALLIAGSYGMTGAAVLAAKACYRTGTGWLKTHLPRCGVNIMQTTVPEAVIGIDENEHFLSTPPIDMDKYNAVAVGCGIGTHLVVQNALHALLKTTPYPMVLDADALNILAAHPEWLILIPQNSIITPHHKEFERLAGKWESDYHCLMLQQEYAMKNKLIVVLKGTYTSIALPDGTIHFNSTGNPGMATAGSGDVLTGIVLGLLAQHYTPSTAAQLGVYLHGLAGDLAREKLSEEALIASDIIEYIGSAYQQLK